MRSLTPAAAMMTLRGVPKLQTMPFVSTWRASRKLICGLLSLVSGDERILHAGFSAGLALWDYLQSHKI